MQLVGFLTNRIMKDWGAMHLEAVQMAKWAVTDLAKPDPSLASGSRYKVVHCRLCACI